MKLQLDKKNQVEAKKDVQETAKEVGNAAVDAKAPVKEVDSSVLGSKSNTVAFVAALGDPSRDDITPEDKTKGTPRRVDPTIVGYAFEALEDMEVPDCGTLDDFKNNPMSYNPEMVQNKKAVKKGEKFNLTRFETGMLLSPEPFNSKATGGEVPVIVAYTKYQNTNKVDGSVAKVSKSSRIPSVSLRPAKTGMSIKDIPMIPVLDFTTEKLPNGGTKKIRTIRPGFEKWAPLCKVNESASKGRSTASANRVTRNKNADIFLQIALAKH